jgi:hypothetical protein
VCVGVGMLVTNVVRGSEVGWVRGGADTRGRWYREQVCVVTGCSVLGTLREVGVG